MKSSKESKVDTGMKFVSGTKVEVLNLKELPSSSWRLAEIISGKGQIYKVKYDVCSSSLGVAVERVPRKAIRPRPPPVHISGGWVPGDIVEVFEDSSWKLAQVSKVDDGNFFFVGLLGRFREFRAHISDIRLRQAWNDNRWVVVQKKYRECNKETVKQQAGIGSFRSEIQLCLESINRCRDVIISAMDQKEFADTRTEISSSAGKRQQTEYGVGPSKKIRGLESKERPRPVDVSAVASPRKADSDWANTNNNRYFFLRSLDATTSESIGSCSVKDTPQSPANHPMPGPDIDVIVLDDDENEACTGSGRHSPVPAEEELAAEFHNQELDSYSRTLADLYASGPINWELQAFLTNLRRTLHISDDEHSLAVRHLLSSGTDSRFPLQQVIPCSF